MNLERKAVAAATALQVSTATGTRTMSPRLSEQHCPLMPHAVQHQSCRPEVRVSVEGGLKLGRRFGTATVIQIEQARSVEFCGGMFFSRLHLRQPIQGLGRCIVLSQPPEGQASVQTGQGSRFPGLPRRPAPMRRARLQTCPVPSGPRPTRTMLPRREACPACPCRG